MYFLDSSMTGNILATDAGTAETVIFTYQQDNVHQFQIG